MDIFKDSFFWFVVVALPVIFPIAGAVIAENKGRNAGVWFLGCLLFPVSGILILLALPRLKSQPGRRSNPSSVQALR